MGKGILASLLIKLGLDDKEFNSGIDGAKKKTDLFGAGIKKIGGMIAGAFAVERIISFGKELVKLSGDVEGVRAAFKKIGTETDLQNMKDSVKGTVSELALMKRAVMASNFGIPAEELGKLFEFATKRAQDTGQSVDYLVESIVIGLGRKSPLILDNLGISIQELRARMGGLSAETATVGELTKVVAQIAEESMRKTGEIIDTNAIKIQALSAEWTDFKTNISENQSVTKSIGGITDALRAYLNVLTSSDVSIWGKLFASFDVTGNMFRKLDAEVKKREELKKANDKNRDSYIAYMESLSKVSNKEETHAKTVKDLIEETERLKDSIGELGINQTGEIQKTLAQIAANEKLIETLTTLKTKREQAFPGDVTMIKPVTELPTIGQSSSALGSQSTLAPEFAGINAFLEKNKKRYEELLKEYQEPFMRFKENMANAVMDFGANVVETFGAAIGEFMATGDFPADFGKNILAIIGGFISQLGKMLIGLGIASEAFQALIKSAFTNPVSAGLAIAAGAALVMLGGALSSAAKAGPMGSSSSGGSVSAGGYSSASSPASSRDYQAKVVFELDGTKLRGVLNNVDRKYSIIR